MARCLLLLTLLSLAAVAVHAQGMSDDYVRERTQARYERPHGLTFSWDLLVEGLLLTQEQKVFADGIPADTLAYDEFDGQDIGIFAETELRMRFSWHDSISFGYGFHVLRSFVDETDEAVGFNGVLYPAGVDADYGSDWHEFRLLYRRDLFRLGLADSFTFFVEAGLEWSLVSAKLGSDTFTVTDDRDTEKFSELLPWYCIGLGFDWELSNSLVLSVQARGSYLNGFPTFQKRDDESVNQAVLSLAGTVGLDWALTDWFSLLLRGKYRYFQAKLYSDIRTDEFFFGGMGVQAGIGFRF